MSPGLTLLHPIARLLDSSQLHELLLHVVSVHQIAVSLFHPLQSRIPVLTGCISQYIRYCIRGMHLSIHYAIVLKGCISQYIRCCIREMHLSIHYTIVLKGCISQYITLIVSHLWQF